SLAARKEKKARRRARRPPPFRWPVQIAVEQLEERELLNASVANNETYSVVKNQTLNVSAAGVLANAVQAAAMPLTPAPANGPQHGLLTLNLSGGFAYTPATNFTGSDTFTYKAQEMGNADSNVATVTINVTAPAPTVTGVSPASGPAKGGTAVTIT